MLGKKVRSNTHTVSASRKGSTPTNTLSTVVLAMRDDTKRLTPKGGVSIPTLVARTIKIPNWIGSIPKALVVGISTGVKMMMRAKVSMNIPSM